jgi:hypothetical protein
MDKYDLAEIVRHVIKLNALLIATETLVHRKQIATSSVNSSVQRIDRLLYNTGARRPHLEHIPFDCTCTPPSQLSIMSDVIRFTNGYLAMSDGQVSHLSSLLSVQAEVSGNQSRPIHIPLIRPHYLRSILILLLQTPTSSNNRSWWKYPLAWSDRCSDKRSLWNRFQRD